MHLKYEFFFQNELFPTLLFPKRAVFIFLQNLIFPYIFLECTYYFPCYWYSNSTTFYSKYAISKTVFGLDFVLFCLIIIKLKMNLIRYTFINNVSTFYVKNRIYVILYNKDIYNHIIVSYRQSS